MFGGAPNTTREGACAPRNEAVALVITLLMLSVITFLTIAFLAMSQRNKTAVSTSIDLANARAASDAARARATSEIIAQMMAHGDALYYDYMVSTAFNSPSNFYKGEGYDPNNVNYDSFFNSSNLTGTYSPADYAQMMANLWYDPRPPVFVVTNQALPASNDFRFWVDINRNGLFETNGYQLMTNIDGSVSYGFLNGEPEWIGILRNPLYAHSSTNLFIGRYAYLVLPIGKELDFNYIHNFAKGNYRSIGNLNNTSYPGNENDGFARDQGIGSWELNLAGLLDAISPWAYENNNSAYPPYPMAYGPYSYIPPYAAMGSSVSGVVNTGIAFDDAESILHYRYPPTAAYAPFMAPLSSALPANYADYANNFIDIYCVVSPSNAPYNYPESVTNVNSETVQQQKANVTIWAWPGSYQTNQFYDVQDLFDPNKTSTNFAARMIQASLRTNSFDRYTFQRLLSCVGMGSSPEYGVWVYGDQDFTFSPALYGSPMFFEPPSVPVNPSQLRTKVNINYDNTAQITNTKAPFTSMPANLVPWTPLGFFTNAAELLLRSQTFGFANYSTNSSGFITETNFFAHFGVTNIPIYRPNQPGIRYDASVHRMLQLAANIYDATVPTNYTSVPDTNGIVPPPLRHPSVFRPLFGLAYSNTTPIGINIIGYAQVTNPPTASTPTTINQLGQPFYDLPDAMAKLQQGVVNSNVNIWGIPWVVGANKGLPQFYQYSYESSILYERKLMFNRYNNGGLPDTNKPPQYTNQFYCMFVSNTFGLDAWNPYPSNFTGSASTGGGTTCYISNYITIQLTNNYNAGFSNYIINVYPPPGKGFVPFGWTGWGLKNGLNDTGGFVTFFQTNVATLQQSYFSPTLNHFVPFTNVYSSNQFLAVDTNQSSTSTGYPVYNWTLNITNHVVYALFDGTPSSGALLDFVNLGPFGNSVPVQQIVAATNYNPSSPGGTLGLGGSVPNPWTIGKATAFRGSPLSQGMINQINYSSEYNANFYNDINGYGSNTIDKGPVFGASFQPSNVVLQTVEYVANDPMVHYTTDDLEFTNTGQASIVTIPVSLTNLYPVLSNSLGKANTKRYWTWDQSVGPYQYNMLFIDPQMKGATNWDFPTNKFPGVGWLGRVHRGTSWQTVYLKSDNPSGTQSAGINWTNWANSPWLPGEALPETYPTSDWALVDLFTTAPDDNAARGLLSVNQTNDAAWAAVFAGVIAPTNFSTTTVPNNAYGGVQIMPNNNGALGNVQNFTNLVDANSPYGGINALRASYANGIFHKVGDIMGASALTVSNAFLGTNAALVANNPDEIVERIPQQILSLLKVGEPQFVIFAWGQSLKPKGPPYLNAGALNNNIYTNYEITGEVLTRTVCHLVHTNGAKMVVDSFNVESGSGN
jgi:hypothetical protein